MPADQARLNWVRPTSNTDGTVIAAATALTYTLYKRSGATDAAVCTTTAASAGQTNLAPGTHTWLVTARVGTGPESGKSNAASKTVDPPVPNPPSNLTVTSTRIEAAEWTCRDATGAVLSSHVRQDKAQEACTNLALANVGLSYEMRPSGYRISAR